jgi:hypothetical protein
MSTAVTIFGESIPVTTTGGIRAPTLKKLLHTRTDLICRLTREFDGMTDGKEPRDQVVGPDWVIKNLLHETSTLRIRPGKLLGVDTISVFDACYNVDIYDGEVIRRKDIIASLPHEGLDPQTPTTLAFSNGRPLFWRTIANARTEHLQATPDGIAFDEEATRLLALTDIEELAVYLGPNSRALQDFSRRSPTIDRSPPGGWPR